MATQTTNYNLTKPATTDYADISVMNTNMDEIDSQMKSNADAASQAAALGIPYAADTSTTANTVTVTLSPAPTAYIDGFVVCVKIANTTTGAATLNVNGLGAVTLKNGDGSAVGNGDLVAGVPVTFRYVGGASPAFIASGSGGLSATGNATAADVLTPYTFTSASGKKQTGTMPDNGGVTITPSTANQTIAQGYHDGSGHVKGDTNLTASNIKSGVPIFGVTGDVIEASGDAGAAQVLTGYSASNTSGGFSGSMPNNGSPTITPGTTNQGLGAGYYGGVTVEGDPNLVGSNILSGKSIFGVPGTVQAKQIASGNFTSPSGASTLTFYSHGASNGTLPYITITGLGFVPTFVLVNIAVPNYQHTIFQLNADWSGQGDNIFCDLQGTLYPLYLDGTSAYANNGSFQLPLPIAGETYAWVAYA